MWQFIRVIAVLSTVGWHVLESTPLSLIRVCTIARIWVVNTLGSGQNGCHFADDIFKCIFLNENVWIPIKISLKFLPKVQSTIFQHWIRQWLGADQATSHYLNQWWLDYRRIYASLGLNELTGCVILAEVIDASAYLCIAFCVSLRSDYRLMLLYYI